MPFGKGLNFFFLYVQQHLKKNHDIDVLRGDSKFLTVPILEKVVDEIENADVVIADLTGNNPNVFFELGIAYRAKKPIILMAQEEPNEIPVDIRSFEYIRYDLDEADDFVAKIDRALASLFEQRYQQLYDRALPELRRFRGDTHVAAPEVDIAEFKRRVLRDERAAGLPDAGSEANLMRFLLPRILDSNDIDLLQRLNGWLGQRYPNA